MLVSDRRTDRMDRRMDGPARTAARQLSRNRTEPTEGESQRLTPNAVYQTQSLVPPRVRRPLLRIDRSKEDQPKRCLRADRSPGPQIRARARGWTTRPPRKNWLPKSSDTPRLITLARLLGGQLKCAWKDSRRRWSSNARKRGKLMSANYERNAGGRSRPPRSIAGPDDPADGT